MQYSQWLPFIPNKSAGNQVFLFVEPLFCGKVVLCVFPKGSSHIVRSSFQSNHFSWGNRLRLTCHPSLQSTQVAWLGFGSTACLAYWVLLALLHRWGNQSSQSVDVLRLVLDPIHRTSTGGVLLFLPCHDTALPPESVPLCSWSYGRQHLFPSCSSCSLSETAPH